MQQRRGRRSGRTDKWKFVWRNPAPRRLTTRRPPARWRRRPPGSNWGDFGVDDQCGRLNLLTAEKVRQGVAEVREGPSA